MLDPRAMSLFPLPLSTFERYMLADDRPEYPMAFVARVKLCGTLRREVFGAALDETLSRHPLFCALVAFGVRWLAPVPLGPLRPVRVRLGPAPPVRAPRASYCQRRASLHVRDHSQPATAADVRGPLE